MTTRKPAWELAQVFPPRDAWRLYEASQLQSPVEREAEIARVTLDLKKLHPHLFRPEALRSTPLF